MSQINCKGFNVFLLGKDKNTDGEHAFFCCASRYDQNQLNKETCKYWAKYWENWANAQPVFVICACRTSFAFSGARREEVC